ncbi:hypothetical protein DVR14_21090 (plasmid) [Natrinema thermotolerans]|nr:hypothetical protein DVR14_21090 [Natrinema thermotolerans]
MDSELQNANGTVEVIVGVEDYPFFGVTAEDDSKIEELKAQAEGAQAPIRQHANQTDGIEFKEGFWLTNAVLLEVDTTVIDIESLAALDSVETIEKNSEVSVQETESAATESGAWGVESVGAPRSGKSTIRWERE